MASILTNTGAMVALQSLRSTNAGLSKVQTEISTGKKVATAKDNAATFAISNVMKSDVAGFKALTESLDLGASTVAVASNAAFQVGELLNEIKGKIISANEENVDRTKLNNEVTSLRDQINGIVSSAQFNGLNLVNGTTNASGFTVLASLDRDASGVISTNTIGVVTANTDLSTATGTDLTAGTNPATTDTNPNTAALIEAGDTNVLGGFTTLDAAGAVVATGGPALAADAVDLTAGTAQDALVEGDQITVTIGNITGKYTVIAGDRSTDIVAGLRQSLVDKGIDSSDYTLDTGTTAGSLTITNNTTVDANYAYSITRGAGGLAGLDTIDVSSAAGAAQALNDVEGFIQTAIDAQAALGTAERRLTIQNDFLAGQIDNFEAGIGALVDADLEAASARLQSLQVQQQLGVQALSIANQAPQSILALFR